MTADMSEVKWVGSMADDLVDLMADEKVVVKVEQLADLMVDVLECYLEMKAAAMMVELTVEN